MSGHYGERGWVPGTPSGNLIRQQLAEALCDVRTVWCGAIGPHELADAMLRTVEKIAARRASEELAMAADRADAEAGYITSRKLRARADALRARAAVEDVS